MFFLLFFYYICKYKKEFFNFVKVINFILLLYSFFIFAIFSNYYHKLIDPATSNKV